MYEQMGSQRELPCSVPLEVSGKVFCTPAEAKSFIDNAIVSSHEDIFIY
jgi:hypothetical protein